MPEPETVTEVAAEPPLAILLAEDDPVTRMLMTRFLKKAGYEVDAVANGGEALDRMTRRYYPILVTDWEMPEMDGVELCSSPPATPRNTSSRGSRPARTTISSNRCTSPSSSRA